MDKAYANDETEPLRSAAARLTIRPFAVARPTITALGPRSSLKHEFASDNCLLYRARCLTLPHGHTCYATVGDAQDIALCVAIKSRDAILQDECEP